MMKRIDKKLMGVAVALLCAACSTTSHLPEGEVLYRGIGQTKIENEDKSEHGAMALEEVEAALACAPNGAFLGSSSLSTPFPVGLWIHNAWGHHRRGVGKWLSNTFGSAPVLISSVNPTLRAKMAANSLQNFGYFRSSVSAEVVPSKNPKKAKVNYVVDMRAPYRLDSIAYVNFPAYPKALIDSTVAERLLRKGDAFSVINLDGERNRIANLLRNHGYYYYRPEYMTYKADTLQVPWNVQLRMEPVATSQIPSEALRRWKVGNITVKMRRNSYQRLTDSLQRRRFKVLYKGERTPLRPRVLLHNLYFRSGQEYSLEKQQLSQENLSQLGVFSQLDFHYTPRDTTALCDTLDLTIDAMMDKPLSAELEVDMRTKSNGQIGPSLSLGLARKNVFRGGETFSVDLNGSYEWQTQRAVGESSSKVNSYELGLSASLEYPRIMFPGLTRLRSRHPRHTLFKVGVNELHRAGFFDLLSFTAEATYTWQHTAVKRYAFSPLRLTYSKLQSTTVRFDSIMQANNSLFLSMKDQFIPAMSFTYTYDDNSKKLRNRTWWSTTVTEGGNLTSLAMVLAGKKFGEEDKQLFNNPYAQFLKVTSELRRTYKLSEKSELATRLMGGVIYTYGNSSVAPYSEQFYIGGANSIRAYTVRAVGPGSYHNENSSFLDQTGDLKFEANMEYRFNMIGNFNGALFLDAGNVWLIRKDVDRPGAEFRLGKMLEQLALGTGFGIRYDMEFLVLRLDLGIAIHNPYKTSRSGYYNIPKFKDGLSLHFAVGYPF